VLYDISVLTHRTPRRFNSSLAMMRSLLRRHSLLLALPLLAAGAPAARAQADTISPRPLFTYRDALLAGGILLGTRLVHPLDDHYKRRLQDSSTQANKKLQTLATVVRTTAAPGAYIIGGTLFVAGRLAKVPKLADLGLHGTEALVVGEVVATTLKGVVGRARPYATENPDDYQFMRGFNGKDEYKSFPSGHSVAAFAAAAAVTSEMAHWYPSSVLYVAPVMYGGAALVGASRMYNNRHWASDVIFGAGIGTFAGLKVVRYQHSHPGNRLDKWLLAGSITPNAEGGQTLHWSLLPGSLGGIRPRGAP
jgi:membrane-associated phospholipid phosphatase